ncbi:MAG: TPM domain-containing protein [Sedimentibacter sp.]|uniref:TPM domain-containing protein n=1 Tax=Sedimentibacter sp. TaxID=1960295 RepID=UPI0031581685
MKKRLLPMILCLTLAITGVFAYGEVKLPEPTNQFYVNDFADLMDDEAEANIVRVNQNYENTKEKPQIIVVTVLDMQGLDEYAYAVELFEKWKIGNKDYDNGILVLLALEERRVKIEVGYGLEGAITDSEAGRILDDNMSYLSKGDYSAGLESIFYSLALKVNEEYGYDNDEVFGGVDVNVQNGTSVDAGAIFKVIMLIILLIIISGGRGGRRRRRNPFIFIPPAGRFDRFGGGPPTGGFGGFGGGGSSGGGGAGRGF